MFEYSTEELKELLQGHMTKEPRGLTKFPLTDISTSEDGTLFIEVACPGFTKEMLKVEVVGNQLHVHGEVEEEPEVYTYYQRNIVQKDFTRKISLGDKYVGSHISIDYTDGILLISIDKAEEDKRTFIDF